MGQFSWMYCDTNNKKQMLDDVEVESFLLIPSPFVEEYKVDAIYESCYDGYGNFGKYDVYEEVAKWNKEFIPQIVAEMKERNSIREADAENLMKYYEGKEINVPLRYLGIAIACYDEDNSKLPYPIKISSTPWVKYEDMPFSMSDPNQGWLCEEDEEDEGSWYEQSW